MAIFNSYDERDPVTPFRGRGSRDRYSPPRRRRPSPRRSPGARRPPSPRKASPKVSRSRPGVGGMFQFAMLVITRGHYWDNGALG